LNYGKFSFLKKSDDPVCQTGYSSFLLVHSVTICSVEPSLAKLDGPVSKIGVSRISRNSDKSCEMTTTDPDDLRTPLVRYLENSSHIADRKVRR
jgi:hypothetical protein